MNITSVNNLSELSRYDSALKLNKTSDSSNRNESFETLFQSIRSMVDETNAYTNAAQEEEMKYAMGLSNNYHDLQAAQLKAYSSLQYTVTVRNSVLDAYKEIMNMQF